jgi:hypothetical protein
MKINSARAMVRFLQIPFFLLISLAFPISYQNGRVAYELTARAINMCQDSADADGLPLVLSDKLNPLSSIVSQISNLESNTNDSDDSVRYSCGENCVGVSAVFSISDPPNPPNSIFDQTSNVDIMDKYQELYISFSSALEELLSEASFSVETRVLQNQLTQAYIRERRENAHHTIDMGTIKSIYAFEDEIYRKLAQDPCYVRLMQALIVKVPEFESVYALTKFLD